MKYSSAEDRLNPVVPPGTSDTTLGGYMAVHGRAAAFEGPDGEPYTVGIETDATGDPAAPFSAYLVFLRWAGTGSAIMGHLTTDDLATGATEREATAALEALPLARVRQVLDETIRRKQAESAGDADA